MSTRVDYRQYLDAIRRIDVASYRAGSTSDDLVIGRSGKVTIEYAPLDYVEHDAQLVIVGLTPGRTQAANALESMARDLAAGVPVEKALANAKRTASFSGSMRASLLAMLDAVGVPRVFGKESASEFFADGEALVHFTSALRYPVYVDGANYSGNPNPFTLPILRAMIENDLAAEADALPNAIWIPLGDHARDALLHLAGSDRLRRENVLAGLPHPSGANAERIAYFLGRKSRDQLSRKTSADRIDEAKKGLLDQVAHLRPQLRFKR